MTVEMLILRQIISHIESKGTFSQTITLQILQLTVFEDGICNIASPGKWHAYNVSYSGESITSVQTILFHWYKVYILYSCIYLINIWWWHWLEWKPWLPSVNVVSFTTMIDVIEISGAYNKERIMANLTLTGHIEDKNESSA